MKGKILISLCLLIALCAVAGSFIYIRHQDRFYMVTNSDGLVYEVDKRTGKTWQLMHGEKTPVREKLSTEKQSQNLPKDALSKVRGRAWHNDSIYDEDTLEIKIHNDSDWLIQEAVIFMNAEDAYGEKWQRNFKVTGEVPPLSDGSLKAPITEAKNLQVESWFIVSATGYRQPQVGGTGVTLTPVEGNPFDPPKSKFGGIPVDPLGTPKSIPGKYDDLINLKDVPQFPEESEPTP